MPRRAIPLLLATLLASCAETPQRRDAAEVTLPPYPQHADLVEFPVSATSANRFMLDRHSLAIDRDREVRLTLMVRSPDGAETVTYEAIRCQSAEYRVYAVGRRDGSWSRTDTPTWRPIEESGLNRHRAALASEYLCDGAGSVLTPERVLSAMRNPAHMQHGIGTAP